jgi:hypothetical protein
MLKFMERWWYYGFDYAMFWRKHNQIKNRNIKGAAQCERNKMKEKT